MSGVNNRTVERNQIMRRVINTLCLCLLPVFCQADSIFLNYLASKPASLLDLGLFKLDIHLGKIDLGTEFNQTNSDLSGTKGLERIWVKTNVSSQLTGTSDEIKEAEKRCAGVLYKWRLNAGVYKGVLVSQDASNWGLIFKPSDLEEGLGAGMPNVLFGSLDNYFVLSCEVRFLNANVHVSGALVSDQHIVDIRTNLDPPESYTLEEFYELVHGS
jgi:hypothetical protein